MYIRWIIRKHKNEHAAHLSFHDAYLVESYRDENRKPRQRVVSYLGNIRQFDGEFPGVERELFLLRAQGILHEVQDLSHVEREKLLNQLHSTVAPLTRREMLEGFRNTLRWYYQWGSSDECDSAHEEMQEIFADIQNEFDGDIENEPEKVIP